MIVAVKKYDGLEKKFKLNNPLYPERAVATTRSFTLFKEHSKLEKDAGLEILEMGCAIVIFEYPIILTKRRWRRNVSREIWVTHRIADVIGLKTHRILGPRRTIRLHRYEILWIECGGMYSIRTLLHDSDLLEFLRSLQEYDIKIFHYDWKRNLKMIWENRDTIPNGKNSGARKRVKILKDL